MNVPKITTFNILLILFGIVLGYQVIMAIISKSDIETLAGNLGVSTIMGVAFLFGARTFYKEDDEPEEDNLLEMPPK